MAQQQMEPMVHLGTMRILTKVELLLRQPLEQMAQTALHRLEQMGKAFRFLPSHSASQVVLGGPQGRQATVAAAAAVLECCL